MPIQNIKAKIQLICYLPLAFLLVEIVLSNLGPDPIQTIHIRLGDWSLRFLCITLAITPIQTLTKWRGLTVYRRMFGLFTFGYASLHLFAYLAIDHYFAWQSIAIDLIESSYLWFGLLAYIVLLALALTSTKASQIMLGKKWKKLHNSIYFCSIVAVVHYFWQLKGNLAEPVLYALIVFFLLLFRFLNRLKNRRMAGMAIPRGRREAQDSTSSAD